MQGMLTSASCKAQSNYRTTKRSDADWRTRSVHESWPLFFREDAFQSRRGMYARCRCDLCSDAIIFLQSSEPFFFACIFASGFETASSLALLYPF